MTATVEELREAALAYHDAGEFVIPCRAGTKRPMVKWGQGQKRLSKKALGDFWKDGMNDPPDIAVKMDAKTMVLDLDPRHAEGVRKTFKELRADTRCATTPGNGLHAYYDISARHRPQTFEGLDVLTSGRMALVPPSAGREWVGKDERKQLTSADEAKAVVTRVCRKSGINENVASTELSRDAFASLDNIPEHRRNQTLTSIAGVMRSAGVRGNRLTAVIDGLARNVTDGDPLPMDEIVTICESIDWRRPHPFQTNEFTRYEFNTGTPPPVLKWLIQDFLPAEGVTSLFGMGKQGKSYMAIEILRCLQTKQPFLGMDTLRMAGGRAPRVLYVDWERRGASLKRRLHALAAGEEQFDVTVIEPQGALVNTVDALAAEVALGGFDLVIIDSLTIALMQGDVSEAATVVPAMFALNSMGCPVLVLDHTKKVQQGETYEALSAFGSVFKGNVCSMNWRMKKVSGDAVGMNVAMQHVSNNYDTNPPDIFARIEFEFGVEGLVNTTIERTEDASETDEVFNFLAASASVGGDTVSDVGNGARLTVMQASRALNQLLDKGRVVEEDGTWKAKITSGGEDEEATSE